MSKLSILTVCAFILSHPVYANQLDSALQLKSVTDNVYAIVGPIGNRSKNNLGNSATFGLVVTKKGVVLIDSGATYEGAAKIHSIIQTVAKSPIKVVINTGGQDHRWLGNDYFKQQGARIIANNKAVADQKNRLQDQFYRLASLMGDKAIKRTQPVYADTVFDSQYQFSLGGVEFNIIHAGQAHTPGDSFVWLPNQSVVFTGDIVYSQRMLSIMEFSNSHSWLKAFEAIADLKPKYVVPGHGDVTTLEHASKDTYQYLLFLRKHISEFIKVGGGIENIGKLDQQAFSYLKNFKALKGRNAQQVFQEIEFE